MCWTFDKSSIDEIVFDEITKSFVLLESFIWERDWDTVFIHKDRSYMKQRSAFDIKNLFTLRFWINHNLYLWNHAQTISPEICYWMCWLFCQLSIHIFLLVESFKNTYKIHSSEFQNFLSVTNRWFGRSSTVRTFFRELHRILSK